MFFQKNFQTSLEILFSINSSRIDENEMCSFQGGASRCKGSAYSIFNVAFFRQMNFNIFSRLRVDDEKELSKIQRIMLI